MKNKEQEKTISHTIGPSNDQYSNSNLNNTIIHSNELNRLIENNSNVGIILDIENYIANNDYQTITNICEYAKTLGKNKFRYAYYNTARNDFGDIVTYLKETCKFSIFQVNHDEDNAADQLVYNHLFDNVSNGMKWPNIVIMISGDSDYQWLINYLKHKKVHTIAISNSNSISTEIKKNVNLYIPSDKFI